MQLRPGAPEWLVAVNHLLRRATSCYTTVSITMGMPFSPLSQDSLQRHA
jgi:hypothetical protein